VAYYDGYVEYKLYEIRFREILSNGRSPLEGPTDRLDVLGAVAVQRHARAGVRRSGVEATTASE
jgi:hypothetical protein